MTASLRLVTRTGWALAASAVVLAVAGAALGYPSLLALSLAAGLALAGGATWMARRPDLAITHEVAPERVPRHGEAVAVVTIANRATRPSTPTTVEDRVTGWEATTTTRVLVPRLPARGTASVPFVLDTRRRGVYAVGPATLTRSDPLGLFCHQRRQGGTAPFIVHPVVHPVVSRSAGLTRELEGATRERSPQGFMAFHALRDYERGDDLRLIHWRSTARHQRLIVRQNIDTTLPRMAIVLDVRPHLYDDDMFELAVDLTASILQAVSERRFPLRVVTTDGRAAGGERAASLSSFLDFLAGVERHPDADVAGMARLFGREPAGSTLFVVTGAARTPDLADLGPMCSRFPRTFVVRCAPAGLAPAALGRAQVIDAATPDDLAVGWDRRVPTGRS